MKKILALAFILTFISGYALAQFSSATQIVLGFNSITSPYWQQYTSANPLPVGSR